ncbi:DUF983 domain-containing protein [Flavobacterium nitrogenifigens]|nr:DUF983 domain-containing protein [Flavobacterium nitrogenifigens]
MDISKMKKGSRLNSILTGSCPKCQNGNMYVDKNLLHLGSVLKMHEKCSHCGLRYQIEPSFFFGAMYVSYGLNVGVGIAVFAISYLIFDSGIKTSFIAITAVLVILFPILLRLSRNIYINMFVCYDPKAAIKKE